MRLYNFKLPILLLTLLINPLSFGNTTSTQNVNNRAADLFLLLSSEFLLTEGYSQFSLDNYYQVLESTHDPLVAERAMQIALMSKDYRKLEEIENLRKKYHLKNTSGIERIEWEQQIIAKNYSYVFKHAENLLKSSNQKQQSLIFNRLTALLLQDPSVASYSPTVMKLTKPYPDSSDAIITNIAYAANNKDKNTTLKSLVKIHQLIATPDPRISLLLQYLNTINPDYLNSFFKSLPVTDYQEAWISIYINQFFEQKDYVSASEIINKALTVYPNTLLFTQAGYLAAMNKLPQTVSTQYFEKAYHLGENKEKNYVADFAASSALSIGDISLAKSWLEKIVDRDYFFDKFLMTASIAYLEKNKQTFNQSLKSLEELPKSNGPLFDFADYVPLKLLQLEEEKNAKHALKQLSNLEKIITTANATDKKTLLSILSMKGYLLAFKLNKQNDAEQIYRRALEIDRNAITLNQLGYLLLQTNQEKNYQEALPLLEEAYSKDNQSPEIQDSLGWAYVLNKQLNKALPLLENAYQSKKTAEIAEHYAQALRLTNQNEKAKEIVLEANQLEPNNKNLKKLLKNLK